MPVTRQNLEDLPSTPGVYIMRDVTGKVIYVGKAVVLKNRVRQYFNNSPKLPKVQAMVDNVDRFEYIITLTEKDALSLEANLVKKYNPHYNILLKDDKASPYIRIDTREEFPTVEVTRKLKKRRSKVLRSVFERAESVGYSRHNKDCVRNAYLQKKNAKETVPLLSHRTMQSAVRRTNIQGRI